MFANLFCGGSEAENLQVINSAALSTGLIMAAWMPRQRCEPLREHNSDGLAVKIIALINPAAK